MFVLINPVRALHPAGALPRAGLAGRLSCVARGSTRPDSARGTADLCLSTENTGYIAIHCSLAQ